MESHGTGRPNWVQLLQFRGVERRPQTKLGLAGATQRQELSGLQGLVMGLMEQSKGWGGAEALATRRKVHKQREQGLERPAICE